MISPPVRWPRRYSRLGNIVRLLFFALATIASAGAIGGLSGAIGALVKNYCSSAQFLCFSYVLAITALTYGLAELFGLKCWVPTRHWLVPRRVGAYGAPRAEIVFGLLLGTGLFTVVTFIGYHLLLVNCFITASPVEGVVLMAVFGLARALPVLLVPASYWIVFGTYDFTMAREASSRLALIDQKLHSLRSLVLFAVAGSAISVALAHV